MNNVMKRMLLLMALGCVEKISCDWRDTWDRFKSTASRDWKLVKDKVEKKWHNKDKVEEKWHNFENKSNNETIIQKFDANNMKNFFNDPEQKKFKFMSSTGKKIKFVREYVTLDRITLYFDGIKPVYFSSSSSISNILENLISIKFLLKYFMEHNVLAEKELLPFISALGIECTDDFDIFIRLIKNKKNGKEYGGCIFKNEHGEFIIFEKLFKKYTYRFNFVFAGVDCSTDNPEECKETLKRYFTQEQAEKIYNKIKKPWYSFLF